LKPSLGKTEQGPVGPVSKKKQGKKKKNWAWWLMPVIPARHEADARGSQTKASPGKKNKRVSLKNKLKQKGLET
jgi:hypothetical protein